MTQTMRAVVYQRTGLFALEERPVPRIQTPTDAIVRVTLASICSSDLQSRADLYRKRCRGPSWATSLWAWWRRSGRRCAP